jgi:hypothetical protein
VLTATELTCGDLALDVDTGRGVLRALRDRRDRPDRPGPADRTDRPDRTDRHGGGLNYLGGPVAFPPAPGDGALGEEELWTGDLVCRVWEDGGGWRLESTARSADIRTVHTALAADGRPEVTEVSYAGGSASPGGLRRLSVRQSYRAAPGGVRWTIELANRGTGPLEVGEIAIPLVANTDVAGIFAGRPPAARAGGEPQRRWHEDRVQQYLHVAGHGSYVLLQRPSGQGRILSVVPHGDTAIEAAYQVDPRTGSQWSLVFEGPYFLAARSRAARSAYGWLSNRERQNQWLHGNTSLLLAPGQSTVLAFELALLDDAADLGQRLVDAGQVAVEAAPGFTVPAGRDITVAIRCADRPRLLPESSAVTVTPLPGQTPGLHLFSLAFGSAGQKSVKVCYGRNRWTRLLCYVTPRAGDLLRARAAFIAREQLYDNPGDPFGRHHAFLPYDDQLQQAYTDSEEAWQAGGSDEYGLPVAMFLAEKNARRPEPAEIRALDTYIGDWLLGTLQDPVTLDIRRGMYHVEPLPSRRPHEWTEPQSRGAWRFNNYPLVANIYHAMYRIAVGNAAATEFSANKYLTLAWKTAVRGFEAGHLPGVGAPAGAGLFSLLDDLDGTDPEGFRALDAHLRRFAELAAADPYPYGSELYIDQTAHSQVYAALERYGPADLLDRCARVTRTLRWGFQPSWFRYGQEQRGSVCCWYGTPQNSEVLLRAFQRTGDPRLVRLATAGLTSFLTSVRASGAARGWFTWWPDRTGFDSRSLDTDLGLYAYLRAAAAYVLTEPPFGLVGYCCDARRRPDGAIEVRPDNGVDDTIHFCDHGLSVRATGPIVRAVLSADAGRVSLEVELPRPGRPAPTARADGRAVTIDVRPYSGEDLGPAGRPPPGLNSRMGAS